jgi:hypothetical protein
MGLTEVRIHMERTIDLAHAIQQENATDDDG